MKYRKVGKTNKRRDYVIAALNHEETSPVPYQLDLTEVVAERLKQHLNVSNISGEIGNYLAKARNENFTDLTAGKKQDMFGVIWQEVETGDFGLVVNKLLPEPNLTDYTFPEPDQELIQEKCRRLEKEASEKFSMYIIGFSLFERAWTMRGMEDLLMDFIKYPDFTRELFQRISEYNLKVIEIVANYDIDCIFFGDDWGQQRGLIMGPKYWREFIKPPLARMYRFAKDKGLYLAQHSCGDVATIFPDLIEIGLDIYNTFQPEIYDVEFIKRAYGDKLTFYGGISTQQLLPQANPNEVKEETRRLINIMARNGGYIVAPTHDIPKDVPLENVLAFLEVVQNQKLIMN